MVPLMKEKGYPTDYAVNVTVTAAIVGLLLFPNVLIVHYSVDWWRSLHQKATITRLDPTIEGTMLFTLMLGIAYAATPIPQPNDLISAQTTIVSASISTGRPWVSHPAMRGTWRPCMAGTG